MKTFFSTFVVLVLFLSFGCNRCDPPQIINNGSIDETFLAMLPYKAGDTLKLIHSGGQIINFEIEENTHTEQTYQEEYCNEYLYEYQVVENIFTSDFPIFGLKTYMSNMDTISAWFGISVGQYGFTIPTNDFERENFPPKDSVLIEKFWYKDVYAIKTYVDTYFSDDHSIRPDSLFYNYTFGILQIKMTNHETYTLLR